MAERKKRTLITLARIGVTLVLLVVIALTVDLSQSWQVMRRSDWVYLGLAWLLYQVGILVRSYRWQELLRLNNIHVPFTKLLGLYYTGTFFNSFLPTGFGGDVVKMIELTQDGTESELAISTVLADRLSGLAILLLMALVAIPFGISLVPASVIAALGVLAAVFFSGISLFTNRQVIAFISGCKPMGRLLSRPKILAFIESFHNYLTKAIWKSLLASLLFNLLLVVVYILLGQAVGVNINPVYYLLFVPIISTLTLLPISISGLGVREGSYVLLFGKAGVPASMALAMSLLFYALNVVTGLTGGLIYLARAIRGAHAKSGTKM